MAVTSVASLDDRGMRLFQLTVKQYHQMIEQGILPEGEPLELLNGVVVRKDRSASGENRITIGDEHAHVLMKLTQLNPKLERLGCHLRPQLPVLLPPYDEPEPDGAIVRGSVEDYADRKPVRADILCVIEIADSSLWRDRGPKLRIYAKSGIGRYIIVNLQDRVVEVYTKPLRSGRYGQTVTIEGTGTVTLPTSKGRGFDIAISRLLPPSAGRGQRGARNGRH
jgi:Uma2 family endonuclease